MSNFISDLLRLYTVITVKEFKDDFIKNYKSEHRKYQLHGEEKIRVVYCNNPKDVTCICVDTITKDMNDFIDEVKERINDIKTKTTELTLHEINHDNTSLIERQHNRLMIVNDVKELLSKINYYIYEHYMTSKHMVNANKEFIKTLLINIEDKVDSIIHISTTPQQNNDIDIYDNKKSSKIKDAVRKFSIATFIKGANNNKSNKCYDPMKQFLYLFNKFMEPNAFSDIINQETYKKLKEDVRFVCEEMSISHSQDLIREIRKILKNDYKLANCYFLIPNLINDAMNLGIERIPNDVRQNVIKHYDRIVTKHTEDVQRQNIRQFNCTCYDLLNCYLDKDHFNKFSKYMYINKCKDKYDKDDLLN